MPKNEDISFRLSPERIFKICIPRRLYKMSCLQIPTDAETNAMVKAFALDLKSFTVMDKESKVNYSVICCICDSIPTKAQWCTSLPIKIFIKLCNHGKLLKFDSLKSYNQDLKDHYMAKDASLKIFILSPQTYVSPSDKVLLFRQCLSELQSNLTKDKSRRSSPTESIIWG
jgi:hypothetical protein